VELIGFVIDIYRGGRRRTAAALVVIVAIVVIVVFSVAKLSAK
jgi:hypothetical protein